MGFESVARTHVGCRRKINEDAVLGRSDLGLWAVADGMGGHDAGELASALVVDSLAACQPSEDLRSIVDAAKAAIEHANVELLAMGQAAPTMRTIGSTVVVMLADATAFICLWAGDSRAYRARAGAIAQLTRDHSLVQDLVEIGEIDPADAATHPNANVVTRAVGADARLDLDRIDGDVIAGDVFLLASDGLTRLVSDGELLGALLGKNLEASADRLIDLCLARGAPDNASLVIVRAG